jgi:hypothetical protein
LNSRGCNNEATEVMLHGKKCNNFCCYDCYLIYKGKKRPPAPIRQKFEDPDRQRLHDLYIWAMTDKDPRKPYIEPGRRGVKTGTIRGNYKTKTKKSNLIKKNCKTCGREFTTSNTRKICCSNRCRQKAYRKRKTISEVERKKELFKNI